MGVFREVGFRGMFEKNGKNGLMGGRRWVGMVEKGRRRCFGGGEGVGRRWVAGFWI
jgi:hypothetical protein